MRTNSSPASDARTRARATTHAPTLSRAIRRATLRTREPMHTSRWCFKLTTNRQHKSPTTDRQRRHTKGATIAIGRCPNSLCATARKPKHKTTEKASTRRHHRSETEATRIQSDQLDTLHPLAREETRQTNQKEHQAPRMPDEAAAKPNQPTKAGSTTHAAMCAHEERLPRG